MDLLNAGLLLAKVGRNVPLHLLGQFLVTDYDNKRASFIPRMAGRGSSAAAAPKPSKKRKRTRN